MSEWIKLDNQKPTREQWAWTFNADRSWGGIEIMQWEDGTRFGVPDGGSFISGDGAYIVTHYIPLDKPEPPETDG